MNKQKIIFFGTPDFVIPIAQRLADNFELVGIVTTPDTMQGRHKVLTPSPVKAYAKEQNIPIFNLDELKTENRKLTTDPDLFVVAAYGKIIPQSILDIPEKGAINIHPSLLPKYRGTSPIQTALLNGDEVSGVSIIQIDAKMDHGPILSQWEIPFKSTDTFQSLHYSMFQDAADRLPQIIKDYIEGKIEIKPQDDTKATFCKMITRDNGYFDSTNPPDSQSLDRMIRAYYPWPTAWTRLHQDYGGQALHGKIVKFYPEGKIQMEGKNIVTVKEFLNGYPELKQWLEQLLPELKQGELP